MSASVRVAAVGDLHCTRDSQGRFQAVFSQVAARADVLALCGDLTDYGLVEEARVLARELAGVGVPVVGVLGNHDLETGHGDEVATILGEAGVVILDGEAREIKGLAFAGVKGFCGGFGRHTLEPWGEPIVKAFVQEAVNEAIKLEKALARIRGMPRIALLHYAPISGTVAGEPPEIIPFVGSSRLEEPLNRYRVTACFHGHAHRGSLEGQTLTGVPVYNVAMPLLRRSLGDAPPFRVIEIALEEVDPAPAAETPRRRKDDLLAPA
jgi:Icc-related predicted phosphoesterase